jgi:hypothetical protein
MPAVLVSAGASIRRRQSERRRFQKFPATFHHIQMTWNSPNQHGCAVSRDHKNIACTATFAAELVKIKYTDFQLLTFGKNGEFEITA